MLSGVNAGFIITANNQCKYFIKEFSEALGSPSSSTK